MHSSVYASPLCARETSLSQSYIDRDSQPFCDHAPLQYFDR